MILWRITRVQCVLYSCRVMFFFFLQAYARFSSIPLSIRATNNPFKSPNGQLPVLRYQNSTFCTVDKILEVFRQHKYSPDNDVTRLQNAEVAAFNTMLEECIHPALQYLWYGIAVINCIPWLKNLTDLSDFVNQGSVDVSV